MKTPSTYTQNNFVSYLILLLVFFVLLFFTKPLYSQLQILLDSKQQQEQEQSEKQKKLWVLNDLQAKLGEEGSDALKEIQGFSGSFSDKDMTQYIYSYAQEVNLGTERIIIRELKLSNLWESDLWFAKAEIEISAIFSSETTLFSFMNYLTSDTGTYRFFITDFTYPMNEASWNIQATIPLTLYYK
jgi:hypothetical protein